VQLTYSVCPGGDRVRRTLDRCRISHPTDRRSPEGRCGRLELPADRTDLLWPGGVLMMSPRRLANRAIHHDVTRVDGHPLCTAGVARQSTVGIRWNFHRHRRIELHHGGRGICVAFGQLHGAAKETLNPGNHSGFRVAGPSTHETRATNPSKPRMRHFAACVSARTA
jgi:hypothetical protein